MWKLDLYLFLKARDVAHVSSVSPANIGQRVNGNNQCAYDTMKVVCLLWQKTEDVNLVFFGYYLYFPTFLKSCFRKDECYCLMHY